MPSKESRVPDLSLKVIDDGRLQLLNFVGAGCHGTIYRARDRKAPSGQFTFYAVKVVPIADPFTRYGRLQAREVSCHKYVSGHPNVIKLHRIVRDDEFIYLVLDYCPSGDMHKLLIERMTIARNDVLIRNLFLQLIDAVDACHQNGIFHRDLKPANILVSADATHLYLSDFGLATKQLHCTSFGTGTGSYMSPDCINADGVHLAYDPRRADIWALGVILINMVTGRYPWARAVREDQFYGQYLEDTHVLRYMLPISQGMHDILASVFTPLPKDSIDLRTMRRLIVDLDTFYMSEEELADASVNAKRCWKSYYPLAIGEAPPSLSDSSTSMMETASLDSATDAESASDASNVRSGGAVASPITDGQPCGDADACASPVPSQPQGVFTLGTSGSPSASASNRAVYEHRDDNAIQASSAPSLYDTASSSEDTDGPATPETHAQDPAVAVPELDLEAGLGEPLDGNKASDKQKRDYPGRQLLRNLFHFRRRRAVV